MNMLVLAFIFAVGALALFAYALWIKYKQPVDTSQKQGSSDFMVREEPMGVKLEAQISALGGEIGKLASENDLLKEQLELAHKIEGDLKEELSGFKQLKNGWASEMGKIDKLQPLKPDNREMLDRIASLDAKISEYKVEIEKQGQIILEMKDKGKSPGASEEEYNNLKRQLQLDGEVLKKYKEDNESINKEYNEIKRQLREKEEALNKLSENQGISQQEYNRLKVKLQQAEDVLKIIHAEG